MLTPDEEPISGKSSDVFNDFWENTNSRWYPATNWINPTDSLLFTEVMTFTKRYLTMLYYG